MELKIIYEDKDLLVIDKPAGIVVFLEGVSPRTDPGLTLIDLLIEKKPELAEVGEPPRYGVIHRLDKDTSGILLIAKNNDSLAFFQKQFEERKVRKKYVALVSGDVKQESGVIETLIGRSPKDGKKQKVYLKGEPGSEGKRRAITEYKVLKRYKYSTPGVEKRLTPGVENTYTLLEIQPKTGRKHQLRCHLAHINHPIVCDKLYGFKNQFCPENLKRHFLHAKYLMLKLPSGLVQEFVSELAEDLLAVLENLEEMD